MNGVEQVGEALIRISDELPNHGMPARTELNVGAWAQGSTPESGGDAVSLRIYQRSDFRAEMLARSTITGAVQDQRQRYDGKPAYVYVLQNRGGETWWATTGEYLVDFGQPGRVSGSFSAHMTHVYDELPAHDIEVSFDGPVNLRCYVTREPDITSQPLDREFESEFCAPFADFDGVE